MIRKPRTGVRTFAVGAVSAIATTAVLLQPQAATVTAEAPSVRTVAAESDECGEVLTKADGSAWECTFVDEFQGRDLDRDNWLVGESSWSGYRLGQTCFTAERKNVMVRGGALALTAQDEGRPFVCRTPSGDFTTQYTGGHVTTRDAFAQAYGRFEVRAKFPTGRTPGLHGAFWMMPAEPTYGPWPHSGEIDVAEWRSAFGEYVLPSLHYAGRSWWDDTGWGCTQADVSRYHTYVLEWGPDEMRFYQDGELCFRRSWVPDDPLVAPQPFDQPFHLILTMGVGKDSGGNAVSDGTEFPGEFAIDHVKAWQ